MACYLRRILQYQQQLMAQRKPSEKKISPFVQKLLAILDDPESKGCIQWVSSEAFSIVELNTFSLRILPKYYKHHNLSSFIRQLNIYGFNKLKIASDSQTYSHPNFVRNNKKKLRLIQRRYHSRSDATAKESDSKQVDQTKVSIAKNLDVLKSENQQYKLKNKLIQEEINKLTEQRNKEIQNMTNFFCSLLDNNFELSEGSVQQDEENYKTIIYTLDQIKFLKDDQILCKEERIQKMIAYLSEKKQELEHRRSDRSINNDQKECEPELESLDNEDDNNVKETEMFELNQIEDQCNEYFSNEQAMDEDRTQFQKFLDNIF